MTDSSASHLPFPFTSVVLEGAAPDPSLFDDILRGEGDLAEMEYGYCVTGGEQDGSPRFLLFFHRKPYAAGVFTAPGEMDTSSIRDFFVHLARNPRLEMTFAKTDPVLVKSILVLVEGTPEIQGSAEYLRIEPKVVGLMEGRKDALVALVQDGRYSLAFAMGGKVVRAYFYDQFVESSGGIEWVDLFRRIETQQIRGRQTRILVFENMDTRPADDYVEGEFADPGGVFKHYIRPLPELVVRDKVRTLKRVTVHRFPFVIGRSDEADLVLGDAGVSRKHAAIEERQGKFIIRDLGSLNGLFVNDHFTKEFALQDGDRITVGSHILQVVLPRSPAEDVSLMSTPSDDATMAMDREAKVRVSCPNCGAVGHLEAKKLYLKKRVRIRCPKCGGRFEPAR